MSFLAGCWVVIFLDVNLAIVYDSEDKRTLCNKQTMDHAKVHDVELYDKCLNATKKCEVLVKEGVPTGIVNKEVL